MGLRRKVAGERRQGDTGLFRCCSSGAEREPGLFGGSEEVGPVEVPRPDTLDKAKAGVGREGSSSSRPLARCWDRGVDGGRLGQQRRRGGGAGAEVLGLLAPPDARDNARRPVVSRARADLHLHFFQKGRRRAVALSMAQSCASDPSSSCHFLQIEQSSITDLPLSDVKNRWLPRAPLAGGSRVSRRRTEATCSEGGPRNRPGRPAEAEQTTAPGKRGGALVSVVAVF